MDISHLASNRLDRARPLRDQIYTLLRQLIVTGELAAGETVDEKAIAAGLNVSRTPVREAVRKLLDEQLVDVRAQSGTTVTQIDRHQIEEAYLIRRALESESAALAATKMGEEDGHRLEDLVMLHAAALSRHRYAEAIALDDAFHQAIADICGYPRFWRAIEISKAPLDRCRHAMIPRDGEGEATLAEHRAILAALVARDPETARQAMRAHLDTVVEKTLAELASIMVDGGSDSARDTTANHREDA